MTIKKRIKKLAKAIRKHPGIHGITFVDSFRIAKWYVNCGSFVDMPPQVDYYMETYSDCDPSDMYAVIHIQGVTLASLMTK